MLLSKRKTSHRRVKKYKFSSCSILIFDNLILQLMMDLGLIRNCGNGTFYILPLLQRSVEKLTRILDRHMRAIDGQKITMPTLTSADLWKQTGRFENAQTELMVVKDRHEKLQLLSPVSRLTKPFSSLTFHILDSRRKCYIASGFSLASYLPKFPDAILSNYSEVPR